MGPQLIWRQERQSGRVPSQSGGWKVNPDGSPVNLADGKLIRTGSYSIGTVKILIFCTLIYIKKEEPFPAPLFCNLLICISEFNSQGKNDFVFIDVIFDKLCSENI